MAALTCVIGASAQEAYACYTSSNTTLSFYYDNLRDRRPGTTYDLNAGATDTGWDTDGTNASVTRVVFDPSFADARPTTTYDWFYMMQNLQTITGLSYLNTSEVTNMGWMFTRCSSLNSLDLSGFNTSGVTNMGEMFNGCTSLQTIYVGNGWSTVAVVASADMFKNCTSLVGGKGTTYDDNHTDKTYAHIDGAPSNPGYFTDKNGLEPYACYTESNTTLTFYCDNQRSSRPGTTYDLNTGSNEPDWYADGTYEHVTHAVFVPSFDNARPTTTFSWFCDMQNLQTITGMNYLNTSEVTNMAWMFASCNALTDLDLSSFNTCNVTSMWGMFVDCYLLQSIDLSSFNTSNVTDMESMFYHCANLRAIDVGYGWSTDAVTHSSNMFFHCTFLVGGQGTTYNASHIDKTYARIDGGPRNPGYLTGKDNAMRGDVDGNIDVNMDDLTTLINYLLTSNSAGINTANAASCDSPSSTTVTMDDLTALINYLLNNSWQ